jgi:F0F1-type ATP synthase assembly protein I
MGISEWKAKQMKNPLDDSEEYHYVIVLDAWDILAAFVVGAVFGVEIGLMIEAHIAGLL